VNKLFLSQKIIFLKIEKFVIPEIEKLENTGIQTGIFKQKGPAIFQICKSLK